MAAHEAGHAVQYAENYGPVRLRTAIIPTTRIGSSLSFILLLVGLVLYNQSLFFIGIVLFSFTTLFQLVTLPVEFNASARAIATIDGAGLLDEDELPGAKKGAAGRGVDLCGGAADEPAAADAVCADLYRPRRPRSGRQPMRAPNARDTALRVLVSCRTAGAWADAALRAQLRRDGLSGPEAALCSRIVYGVMQNRLLLDFYLGAYCSQKVDHLQPPLLEILRIGAYQILFLDKIPHSAAVNQAVEQAKDNGRAKAAGLVNAVLRQLSRNKVHLPRIPDQDALHSLSIRYSHPKWLVKRLQAILGPETEACLAADNARRR